MWSLLTTLLLKTRCNLSITFDQSTKSFNKIMTNRKTIFNVWFVFSNWSFVWKWYVVTNKKHTSKKRNISIQKSNMNFRSRSKIIVFDTFQSTIFNRFNKFFFHWIVDQIIFFMTTIFRLLNLHVTNMTTSKSSRNLNKIKMKSIINVWKNINDVNIDCKTSYDLW